MLKTVLKKLGLYPSSGFQSGKGASKHFISCKKNPFDVSPAAELIVNRAIDMLDELEEGQPLVILMAEEHSTASHNVLQQSVAAQLLEQGHKFTFNFECSHNKLAAIATNIMGYSIPEPLYYNFSVFDTDGKAGLSAKIGCLEDVHAPLSHNSVMDFCYKNNISSQFNDAASIQSSDYSAILDLHDPFTGKIAREYGHTNQKVIDAESPEGVSIRNIVMARRALDHAKSKNINIIVQTAGFFHVLGYSPDNINYEDSLCAAYRKAGAAVLPVLPTHKQYKLGIDCIPEEARDEIKQSVIVSDLIALRCFHKNYAAKKGIDLPPDMEETLLSGMMKLSSKGEKPFLSSKEDRVSYINLADHHILDIQTTYAAESQANDNNHSQCEKPSPVIRTGHTPKF